MSVKELYSRINTEFGSRGIFIDRKDISTVVKLIIRSIVSTLEDNDRIAIDKEKSITIEKKKGFYKLKVNNKINIKDNISMIDKKSLDYFNGIFLPLIDDEREDTEEKD